MKIPAICRYFYGSGCDVLLPAPGIGEGLGEGDFGGPAEGAADLVGVRVARRNIAMATGSDGVWYFDPGFAFKRLYELGNARPVAGTDIVDIICRLVGFGGEQMVEGGDMSAGEVDHVDIVADTRPPPRLSTRS